VYRWTILEKQARIEVESVVRRHGWLSEMTADFQDAWLAKCDLITIAATQQLYQAGDGPGALYGVAQGRLEIHMPYIGAPSPLAYFGGPGFWLGETGVAGGNRVISVIARSKCRLFRMPRPQMQHLGVEPGVLWRNLAALLMKNIATTISVVDALKRQDPAARVAAMLLNLLTDLPEGQRNINVTQTDLAAITNLSRSSVVSALNHLESLALVNRTYRSITITNLSKLRKLADHS
jgi:CRP/FNR family transcriptional regulator, cyclic AMP receptor protein